MTTIQSSSRPVSRTAIWFFRVGGPALLVSLLLQQFILAPENTTYQFVAGPLYLVAWVGSYLAFIECRRTSRAFAVPFALFALAILLLAAATLSSSMLPMLPTDTRTQLADAARIVHGLAALAMTYVGWTHSVRRRT